MQSFNEQQRIREILQEKINMGGCGGNGGYGTRKGALTRKYRKRASMNPWLQYLSDFRSLYGNDYVSQTQLVQDAAQNYRSQYGTKSKSYRKRKTVTKRKKSLGRGYDSEDLDSLGGVLIGGKRYKKGGVLVGGLRSTSNRGLLGNLLSDLNTKLRIR